MAGRIFPSTALADWFGQHVTNQAAQAKTLLRRNGREVTRHGKRVKRLIERLAG